MSSEHWQAGFTNCLRESKEVPAIQHTVDCLQTIGVCQQSTVCLFTNVLMFFSSNPMILENIKVFLKNIMVVSKLPKGALPNAQGSDG